jgi:penicillin-binding protein 1A
VHGIEVAGGTFPAQIWHDYMTVAHTDCKPFPRPLHPASGSTFFGDHSSSGTSGTYNYRAPSSANNSAGGSGYRGYDPRLYAEPPQGPPPASPPPTPPGNGNGTGGTGPGNGNGNGNP